MTHEDLGWETGRAGRSRSGNRGIEQPDPTCSQTSKQSKEKSTKKGSKGVSRTESTEKWTIKAKANTSLPKISDKVPSTKGKESRSERIQNMLIESVPSQITTPDNIPSQKRSSRSPELLAEDVQSPGAEHLLVENICGQIANAQVVSQYSAPLVPETVPHETLYNEIQKECMTSDRCGNVMKSGSALLAKSATPKSDISVSSESGSRLFTYNIGYYLSGAAAAGVAAIVGAVVYIWSGLRRKEDLIDHEKGNEKLKKRSRLHARDWRQEASTG